MTGGFPCSHQRQILSVREIQLELCGPETLLRMQDEWDDLLHFVIPAIHHHYLKFANAKPRCGCLCDDNGCHLGWRACTVCYLFGHDSNLKDSNDDNGDYLLKGSNRHSVYHTSILYNSCSVDYVQFAFVPRSNLDHRRYITLKLFSSNIGLQRDHFDRVYTIIST